MENKALTIYSVSIPEIEALVSKLKHEYEELNTIEPKHLAERPGVLTNNEAKVFIDGPIQSKAQHAIDELAKRAQVRSQFYNAKDNELHAADEHIKITFQKQEKQRQTAGLQEAKERLACDSSKLKDWRMVSIGALLAASGDAATAYTPIRNVYSVIPALMICIVIALAIGFGHHGYIGWIKKARTRVEKWSKISVVLLIAGAFFYYIGSLRAEAASATISIDPAYHQPQGSIVSALAIAIISFVLFLVVFAVAMHFFVSTEERQRVRESQKAVDDLQAHEAEIKVLETKLDQLKVVALQQRADIRQLNDYYRYIIASIKTMAESTRKEFKRNYARFKHELSDSFAHDEPFVFNEHSNLFSEQQKTK